MLQTTTGSCTRKYAPAQTRNNAGTKPATPARATSKTRNVKNAQQKLQACDGKTRASV